MRSKPTWTIPERRLREKVTIELERLVTYFCSVSSAVCP